MRLRCGGASKVCGVVDGVMVPHLARGGRFHVKGIDISPPFFSSRSPSPQDTNLICVVDVGCYSPDLSGFSVVKPPIQSRSWISRDAFLTLPIVDFLRPISVQRGTVSVNANDHFLLATSQPASDSRA